MKKISNALLLILVCIVIVAVSSCKNAEDTNNNTQKTGEKINTSEEQSLEKEPSKETAANVITENKYLEVEYPTPNAEIPNPVTVKGKSNFFEANTRIRIKDEKGVTLADSFTTAEGWMDKLYPFSKEISYKQTTAKSGFVEVFESSPKDGSEINKLAIPVIFSAKAPVK
ncbi:MAG TPA: hypothetical protein DCP90_08865 [Clostridiales bacterium]|nr:MAG: hypothetical protein A2Y22_03295 [Clostridiales bacterium GWD2_32_59]HAN10706.1 hypothetical protein [Clostridiales bacterium]